MRVFNYLLGVGALVAAGAIPQMASAEKVCKEVCNAGICRSECVETEGRRDRIEERRDDRREERRDERAPGIELRLPVPDIRVNPPH